MLALGCDHGGYPLMKEVIKYLEDNKIAFKNFGTCLLYTSIKSK